MSEPAITLKDTEPETPVAASPETHLEESEVPVQAVAVIETATQSQEPIAESPKTSPKALDGIVRKIALGSTLSIDIASSPEALPETLEWLYKKATGSIRTKKFLDFISNADVTTYQEVRTLATLAGNPTTPTAILNKLALSKWPSVQYGLSTNTSFPLSKRVEILRNMIDGTTEVSSGMMLDALDQDILPEGVRSKKLAELCSNPNEGLLEEVAKMKNLNLETARTLMRSKRDNVKQALFRNTNLPEKAYYDMGLIGDFEMQQVLAQNPALPQEVLHGFVEATVKAFEKIASLRQFENIALALSKNPVAQPEDLETLAKASEGFVSKASLKSIRRAAETASWDAQKAQLENPEEL